MSTIRTHSGLLTILVTLLLVSAGCSTPAVNHTSCSSVECIHQAAEQEAYGECISALNQPIFTKAQQAQIDAAYKYPLRNSSNYAAFVSAGGRGPSPSRWCKAWAEAHMAQANIAQR